MKFTDISVIDPILSILVAVFILINAFRNLKAITFLFLEKTPNNINVSELKEHILKIKDVCDIHHLHIWSIDGYNHCATLHIVAKVNNKKIKEEIKEEFKEHGIGHVTIELEKPNEKCEECQCEIKSSSSHHHHH